MRCFKLLSERVMARDFDRQVAELGRGDSVGGTTGDRHSKEDRIGQHQVDSAKLLPGCAEDATVPVP